MNEINIICNPESPQEKNEEIKISVQNEIKEELAYKFLIGIDGKWKILQDFCDMKEIVWTPEEDGEYILMVQGKSGKSKRPFDYISKTNFYIGNKSVSSIKQVAADEYEKFNSIHSEKLEIKDFKCVSKNLFVNEEITFKVDVEYNSEENILYKFINIDKNGNINWIQDFSSKKIVRLIEENEGDYKLLCLVKDVDSKNEYDDRAVINYTIYSNRKICIENFTTDVSSPQACGSEIKLIADAGRNLLYRFIVNGEDYEDSGFIKDNFYLWRPQNAGKYRLELWVKNSGTKEEGEAFEFLNFDIDKLYGEDVKIVNIISDKGKKVLKKEIINLHVQVSGGLELKYSFVIKKDDDKIRKIDYSENNWIDFIPKESGKYEIEVRVKDKYSNNDYDCHEIITFEVVDFIPAKIDYILSCFKDTYVVEDSIDFELIFRNTKNIVTKYSLKINDLLVEEVDYSTSKSYKFIPKRSGTYIVTFYAKSIRSEETFDDKKHVKFIVKEAAPIINTTILCDKTQMFCNEPVTITAKCDDGKDVVYEFYLMKNGEWNLIQPYSKKDYYTFIPYKEDMYKILVLTKSSYSNQDYEDFSVFEFHAKEKSDENYEVFSSEQPEMKCKDINTV
jgi:hypothetical protein